MTASDYVPIYPDLPLASEGASTDAIPHDPSIYKHRKQIERCFSHLKHFRRFATRYDRRTIHFLGFVHLAAAMMASLNVDPA